MEPPKKQTPVDAKKTVKRLLSYLSHGYKLKFSIVVLCVIVSAITTVISSLFIKNVINDFIEPMLKTNTGDFSNLLSLIFKLLTVFSVGIIATFISNLIMVNISQGILKKIRDEMFVKMQRLPVKFFDTNSYGDIMSKYTNDTDALEQMLCQSIPEVLSSIFTVVFVFASMLYLSIYLTLIVIVFLMLMLFITKKIGGKSRKYFTAQQVCFGKKMGYIEEMINGQKVIKVFNHEQKNIDGFNKLTDEWFFNARQANKYANIFMPIMGNLGHMQYVIIAVIGGALTLTSIPNLTIFGFGVMDVGIIAAFMQLSKSFTRPMSMISQQINGIIMSIAGAERVFKLIDEKIEIDNGYVTLVKIEKDRNGNIKETTDENGIWAWKHPHGDGTLTYTELKGDVRFFDVDFGYEENKIILHNISLYAKPGQKIAFVGATGAGKTTITNLINRFYDLADGKIRYDGININKIKKDDLRHSIGIVLQDTRLFTGTVKDNIRYGKLNATDEEIYNAAKLANADGFIQRLPNGYDTILESDGANLSQGQRQLLTIARAAVANPPVMILDEATSSIDTHTERLIQKGMDALMHGKTVFVIAHRLSTVQNANVIIVLDQGHIIEKGTHEELIKKKGKYYELYTGKLELE